VTERDDEFTLFWRAVRDSAEIYAQCLVRLGRGETLGGRQSEKGHLYLFKHRTWRHERELQRKLRGGLLRGVDLPARVRWFHAVKPSDTTTPSGCAAGKVESRP
jgi:methionyl-tRNA formyltransferase